MAACVDGRSCGPIRASDLLRQLVGIDQRLVVHVALGAQCSEVGVEPARPARLLLGMCAHPTKPAGKLCVLARGRHVPNPSIAEQSLVHLYYPLRYEVLVVVADLALASDAKECSMPIACTLGLTACLTFAGQELPAKDVLAVLDACDLISTLPAASFVQHQPRSGSQADIEQAVRSSWGASMGRTLEEKGIKLAWPPGPAQRQAAWNVTCKQFMQAFNDDRPWTHLELWPK